MYHRQAVWEAVSLLIPSNSKECYRLIYEYGSNHPPKNVKIQHDIERSVHNLPQYGFMFGRLYGFSESGFYAI
jgi:hypothetical protein